MKRRKKKRLARPKVSWPGAGGEEGGRETTLCLPRLAKKEVPPHPKVGGQEEAVSESCQPHGDGDLKLKVVLKM